ncbi:MLO-like protein 3 [Impatiens glandulifera]|uniref:MLO-like protein 3 n=1 Tax=Impatiens glandulifera TaxID=253017 RepID=UPI001FB06D2D|nr:MLO-like protein 3 [Impatiens glandulifera]
MAGGSSSGSSLEYTPTWAVATVCFIMITISIFIEHSIHLLTNLLKKHRKTALIDAVDRLKSELMLLGFVSLLLAVSRNTIAGICIPPRLANVMLPCQKQLDDDKSSDIKDSCTQKGKVSLVAKKAIPQLQILIFVLAVMQIVYCLLTMALGRAKMKKWKTWEKETDTIEYQAANDPNRFRLTRQTTFGRRHMTTCTESTIHLWIKCFFRQFFNSVAKVDYLTLRHGFISAHLSAQSKFNFQKYIEKSLEEDFKSIVGVSPLMWFIVVILLLVDVHGWHAYLWLSCIPLLIVIVVGTKLEVIVVEMAIQLKNLNSVILGAPLVRPSDDFFWFRRPKFILTLIHFTLFVNAFELAFFIWVTIQFGFNSCYHEHLAITVTRIVLAVTIQVLCSYITLPLYALVTQMGSEFNSGSVLNDKVVKILKHWHNSVRDKRKMKKHEEDDDHQPQSFISPCSPNMDFSGHGRRRKWNEQEESSSRVSLNEINATVNNRSSQDEE